MIMALGVQNGKARLEEHNPEWKGMAEELIGELREVLKDDAIDIQHVGSTAIQGIPAKPIIDVAVAVKDVSIAEKYIDALEARGIHYMGEIVKGQRMFCKSTPGCDDRTHHVHFVNINAPQWANYLNFRDYCNSHPDVAKAYGDLKRNLADKYADERVKYHDGKNDFITKTLADAKAWRAEQEAHTGSSYSVS